MNSYMVKVTQQTLQKPLSINAKNKQKHVLQINKQPMGCEAQLALKCLFTPTYAWFMGILTSRLSETDLVFGS